MANTMRAMQDREDTPHTQQDPPLFHHTQLHNRTAHTIRIMPPSTHTTTLPHPQQTQHHTDRREARMRRGGTEHREGAGPNTKTRGHRKEDGDNTRQGDNTTTHPLPPFNGTTTQTEGGHHTQGGEASNTAALHSSCHPPSTTPPHHPQRPHPPPRRGGSRQRIPHHTNTTDTRTHTTHHTRQETVHDMTAVLASTALR